MWLLEVRLNGKREYYGPFPTEERGRRYADAAGWDPGMSDVLPLTLPYAVVQEVVWRKEAGRGN